MQEMYAQWISSWWPCMCADRATAPTCSAPGLAPVSNLVRDNVLAPSSPYLLPRNSVGRCFAAVSRQYVSGGEQPLVRGGGGRGSLEACRARIRVRTHCMLTIGHIIKGHQSAQAVREGLPTLPSIRACRGIEAMTCLTIPRTKSVSLLGGTLATLHLFRICMHAYDCFQYRLGPVSGYAGCVPSLC